MKTCCICKQEKSSEHFAIKRSSSDGLFNMCRLCKSAYNADYYVRTKAIHNPSRAERRQRVLLEKRDWLASYLREHPCVDCGETDIVVLEFDHLRDKVMEVGTLIVRGARLETIIQEVEKCEVVCANCHRRRTAKTFSWHKARMPP